jgi:hypothetical protein
VTSAFARRCPVNDRERAWIDKSVEWFRGQFSDAPLAAPVILPTREFFPPPLPESVCYRTGIAQRPSMANE